MRRLRPCSEARRRPTARWSKAPCAGRENRGRAAPSRRPRPAHRAARPAPFRAELDQYISFTARYGGKGAVMVIDIDGLKEVNDRLGHHAGDNLIRRIAGILRERVRATDIVARLSGDEFAVLMPQTDVGGALQLGEDLRAQVAERAQPSPGLMRRRSAPASPSLAASRTSGRGGAGRRRPGAVPGQGRGPQPGRPFAGPAEARRRPAPARRPRRGFGTRHPGPAQP